jgi:hypothetical protein
MAMGTGGQVLHWVPRGLAVLFAVFISLFALDVFSEGQPLGELLVDLTMHLVPTALIVVALLVAWRWPAAGGVAFLGLGAAYVIMTGGRFQLLALLLIAGPPTLIGLLFIADQFVRGKAGG